MLIANTREAAKLAGCAYIEVTRVDGESA